MKKAKLMLTSLAILAIIGGAFAYKVKLGGAYIAVLTIQDNVSVCTTMDAVLYTLNPNGTVFQSVTTTTDLAATFSSTDCTLTITVSPE